MPPLDSSASSIREEEARAIERPSIGAEPGRTGSATVTLATAVAFVAAMVALGLGPDTSPRSADGWRLRGTLAGAGSMEAAPIATHRAARLPARTKTV